MDRILQKIQSADFDLLEELGGSKDTFLEVKASFESISNKLSKETCSKFVISAIMPVIFNNDTDNVIRDRTTDIGLHCLQFVNLFSLNEKEQDEILNSIEEIYIKVIGELRDSNSPTWDKLWVFLIKFCSYKIHTKMSLANKLLRVVEVAFRNSTSVEQRLKAYDCWKELINNGSLNMHYMCSPKQIKLLMTPMKAKFSRMPVVIIKRCDTFVYLLEKLQDKATLCLKEFLEFCFGPFDYKIDRRLKQGRSVSEVCSRSTGVLIKIFGHTHDESESCLATSDLNLYSPLITKENFANFSEILINSVLECFISLVDWSQDWQKNKIIIKCLWRSILQFIRNSIDEVKKKCWDQINNSLKNLLESSRTNESVYIVLGNMISLIVQEEIVENSKQTLFEASLEMLYHLNDFSTVDLEHIETFILSCFDTENESNFDKIACNFFKTYMKCVNWTLCKIWLKCKIIIVPDNISNLVWPIRHYRTFKDVEALKTKWTNIYTTECKPDSTKYALIKELEKLFNENPLLSSNIVAFLAVISSAENSSARDFVSNFLRLIELILSFPNLSKQDVQIISSIVLTYCNQNQQFYKSENNEEAMDKLCGCLEQIVTIHKDHRILSELPNHLKNSNPKTLAKFSKRLMSFLETMMLNEDNAAVNHTRQLIELLETKENEPGTPSSSRSMRIMSLVNSSKSKKPLGQKSSLPSVKSSTVSSPRNKNIITENKYKKRDLVGMVKEDNSSDYVKVNTEVKINIDKLSEHQKEIFKKRREDIPALYNDLTQSQSQDFFDKLSKKTEEEKSKKRKRSEQDGDEQVSKVAKMDETEDLENADTQTQLPGVIETDLTRLLDEIPSVQKEPPEELLEEIPFKPSPPKIPPMEISTLEDIIQEKPKSQDENLQKELRSPEDETSEESALKQNPKKKLSSEPEETSLKNSSRQEEKLNLETEKKSEPSKKDSTDEKRKSRSPENKLNSELEETPVKRSRRSDKKLELEENSQKKLDSPENKSRNSDDTKPDETEKQETPTKKSRSFEKKLESPSRKSLRNVKKDVDIKEPKNLLDDVLSKGKAENRKTEPTQSSIIPIENGVHKEEIDEIAGRKSKRRKSDFGVSLKKKEEPEGKTKANQSLVEESKKANTPIRRTRKEKLQPRVEDEDVDSNESFSELLARVDKRIQENKQLKKQRDSENKLSKQKVKKASPNEENKHLEGEKLSRRKERKDSSEESKGLEVQKLSRHKEKKVSSPQDEGEENKGQVVQKLSRHKEKKAVSSPQDGGEENKDVDVQKLSRHKEKKISSPQDGSEENRSFDVQTSKKRKKKEDGTEENKILEVPKLSELNEKVVFLPNNERQDKLLELLFKKKEFVSPQQPAETENKFMETQKSKLKEKNVVIYEGRKASRPLIERKLDFHQKDGEEKSPNSKKKNLLGTPEQDRNQNSVLPLKPELKLKFSNSSDKIGEIPRPELDVFEFNAETDETFSEERIQPRKRRPKHAFARAGYSRRRKKPRSREKTFDFHVTGDSPVPLSESPSLRAVAGDDENFTILITRSPPDTPNEGATPETRGSAPEEKQESSGTQEKRRSKHKENREGEDVPEKRRSTSKENLEHSDTPEKRRSASKENQKSPEKKRSPKEHLHGGTPEKRRPKKKQSPNSEDIIESSQEPQVDTSKRRSRLKQTTIDEMMKPVDSEETRTPTEAVSVGKQNQIEKENERKEPTQTFPVRRLSFTEPSQTISLRKREKRSKSLDNKELTREITFSFPENREKNTNDTSADTLTLSPPSAPLEAEKTSATEETSPSAQETLTLSPICSLDKDDLPASPITCDTPDRTTELLNSTSDISPISSQEEVPPMRVTNEVPNVRVARLLQMVNSNVQVSSEGRMWFGTKSSVSRRRGRPRKMKIRKEEDLNILTFSRDLPSPLTLPASGILKRKFSSLEEVATPSPKRKRVNFSDPAISEKKIFIKDFGEYDEENATDKQPFIREDALASFRDFCDHNIKTDSDVIKVLQFVKTTLKFPELEVVTSGDFEQEGTQILPKFISSVEEMSDGNLQILIDEITEFERKCRMEERSTSIQQQIEDYILKLDCDKMNELIETYFSNLQLPDRNQFLVSLMSLASSKLPVNKEFINSHMNIVQTFVNNMDE